MSLLFAAKGLKLVTDVLYAVLSDDQEKKARLLRAGSLHCLRRSAVNYYFNKVLALRFDAAVTR